MTAEISLSGHDRLMVGLSWDHNEEELFNELQVHDLDLSCAVFAKDGSFMDLITPQSPLREKYKHMIFHGGDHMSGSADFEDESVVINFENAADSIGCVAVLVNTKDRTRIWKVKNATLGYHDGVTLNEIYKTDLRAADMAAEATKQNRDGYFLAGMIKESGAGHWDLQPVEKFLDNPDTDLLAEEIKNYL
ncbi:MAG: TerD family protein [Rhodospirillales bacterium]|nr:TerD family protein [Rhodospirillales bacterium]MCB9995590.1 TerD family protein [Rhodospirillales bacterium]